MSVVRVEVADPYDVHVEAGALDRLEPAPGRLAVVLDAEVERLHGAYVRERLRPHRPVFRVVPGGERHKGLGDAAALWDWLGGLRLERGERLCAVGGGVTGDLAGFAAATWRRGVPWVMAPTTLLAMVDASVGGKTAIDTPHGKNLVGAFHQPRQVLADPRFLATLSERERRSGLAEVVKTALLSGPGLMALAAPALDGPLDPGPAAALVAACVAHKAAVVARDPEERGERETLNLGHTVGHALEAAGGYARLLHGEAVAWGLRAALRLSGIGPGAPEHALVERLPRASLDGIPLEAAWEALASDKKAAGGAPRFVLLERAGLARYGRAVPPGRVRAVLEELLREGGGGACAAMLRR